MKVTLPLRFSSIFLPIAVLILSASSANAQTPEERGLEIATAVQEQDNGFIAVSYTHLTLPTKA